MHHPAHLQGVLLILHGEPQRDPAALGDGPQHRTEPRAQRVRVDPDGHGAFTDASSQPVLGLLFQQTHAAGGLDEHLAGLGDPDRGSSPDDHPADVLFQCLDPLPHRRGADAQAGGCGIETPLIDDEQEGIEVTRNHEDDLTSVQFCLFGFITGAP